MLYGVKDASRRYAVAAKRRPSLTPFARDGPGEAGRDEGTGAMQIEQRNIVVQFDVRLMGREPRSLPMAARQMSE